MDVLPLTDVPRPMYEPWKTSIPSPASLQQWPAARWQFPFSLDEGNIPCKLPFSFPGKSMVLPWFPTVLYGSRWFPIDLRFFNMFQDFSAQSMTESGSALRDATKIVMMTMGPQTIQPLWPGIQWEMWCGLKDTQTHTHTELYISIDIILPTHYTCDLCVYIIYIHTHTYYTYIYIEYVLYIYIIYVLFEILRMSPSVSWVLTRHDNIVQMNCKWFECTFAGLLQHFGIDLYRWLNHTKPIVFPIRKPNAQTTQKSSAGSSCGDEDWNRFLASMTRWCTRDRLAELRERDRESESARKRLKGWFLPCQMVSRCWKLHWLYALWHC